MTDRHEIPDEIHAAATAIMTVIRAQQDLLPDDTNRKNYACCLLGGIMAEVANYIGMAGLRSLVNEIFIAFETSGDTRQ